MIHNVLVVCTGNICRSPMAAALVSEAARRRGRELRVGSAGVAALVGAHAAPPAVDLMAARGIDLSGHRARQISEELGLASDLILVMEQGQRQFIVERWPRLRGRVYRLGERHGEEIADPYGLSPKVYEVCLRHVERCVQDWESRLFGGAAGHG